MKRTLTYAALLGTPLAFLGLFFYYPLGSVLREGIPFVKEVLAQPYFQRVILFTVEQALLSTLAAVALGFPLAYLFTRYDFPGKRLLRSLLMVPFVLPAITVALGFILLWGRNGYVNQLLMALFGLGEPPIKILYTLWAIVLAHAFYNAPLIARVVNAAWEGLDPSYEESARALGASPPRVFWTVTLPQLLPSLMSAMTIVFIFCFLSFPIVLTLGGARFSTLEVEIYTQAKALFNRPQAAALAIVGLGFSLLFVYAYLRLGGVFAQELRTERRARPEPLFPSWREALHPHRLALWVFIAVSALLLAGPLLAVLVDSFWVSTPGGKRFGLEGYRFLLQRQYEPRIGDPPLQAVLNSLRFGLSAVGIALPVGLAVAFMVTRLRVPGRRVLDALLMAPIATSSVILGLALLRAYLQPPLAISGTAFAVVAAHAVIVYPFVVRTVAPLLLRFDRSLVEAARSLGASRFRAFWDVERPGIVPGLVVGALFAFALSLGETSATLMLARPGLKTMPVAIYQFISARQALEAAAAMSVVMIAISAVAFVLLERLGERGLRGR